MSQPRPARSIRFKTFLYNTVYDAMRSRGWKETEHETDWDVGWMDVGWMREQFDHIHLQEHQKVNHFRNHYELTRKDFLIKNVKRARKQLEKEDRVQEAAKYDFAPLTFVVPSEYNLFVEEFKRYPGAWWIMKPVGKSQGKGIFLFNKLSSISDWKNNRWRGDAGQSPESYVVQKYVDRPYLVGGKKFDLRLYALVTSYSPLTVWIYRAGFARFSHHRFSMESSEMDNAYIHLTNAAIQKTSEKHDKNLGCKWNLSNLKLFMISKHGMEAVNKLFSDIQMVILLSLFAVQKVMINDKHCFELYGYDILIDEDLKPWLLEVNASPSLTSDTEDDKKLKHMLLNHMLDVVDVEKKLKGDETRVGGFDLVYKNGFIKQDQTNLLSSYLGCWFKHPPPLQLTRLGSAKRKQEEEDDDSDSDSDEPI
ncbi:tubulin tyrosine ligase [Andalucia godoyi]|uniref:Tubulin--tyrosine ligase-like protein 9 n=1 Tax=Andalucia godoyi TaxID=505711 RepID=A0A8K0AI09_ANDGO|nr:tubulin tyrosine ligase [Andalucia godoyi]|eukprot:ANDGO_03577.mRNA.1 tubulin tyrosine ligase